TTFLDLDRELLSEVVLEGFGAEPDRAALDTLADLAREQGMLEEPVDLDAFLPGCGRRVGAGPRGSEPAGQVGQGAGGRRQRVRPAAGELPGQVRGRAADGRPAAVAGDHLLGPVGGTQDETEAGPARDLGVALLG